MDPYTWWCAYGTYAPSLQKLALRLLVQPAFSSCCERNWSTYSFIHSVRRNKMVPQRAEDLVFIHSNLRLLSRRSSQYLQGETKMWDIAGDNFDSLDDIGMLGIANLSLDEPAMEAILFTDEGEDGGGGSFLSKKNKLLLEWKKVHDSLSIEVKNNSSLEMLERILLLSYIDLPYHLKCCFLYLSVFPEDYLIKRIKIIRLWVVERFVEEKPGLTAEEDVEDYLNELVSRSMIQVVQKDNFNRVRTCCVHDIMREIIQLKSRDISFAMILLNDRRMSTDEKIRRMSIHANCKEELPSDMRFTSLRSLLVFVSTRSSMSLGKTFFKGFKLLGVLELELAPLYEFPPELTEMIHLRYLSLRSTMLRKLPESIGKLKKLEILDLKHCLMTCISSLPNGILKLKHLCQLRAYGYCFESSTMFASTYGMNLPGKIGELTNLQKLGNVEVNDNGDMLRELGKLTQLRRLGILKLTQENGMELCSLEKLKHLTALYMVSISTTEPLHLNSLSSGPRFLQRLYLKYSLPTLPKWIASLQYLAKLVLQHSNLNDDPLKSLHGLPNLVVLELREAFVGEELCCNIGGYPRLKKLSLQQLSQLKCLRVEQGAMPGLRGLDIAACEKLEMVPLGIKHLRNLQRLMVWFMPWRFYQTIARPHGEDFWKVQHIQTIEAIY
ncbi:disease resistance protein RPM1-like [Camellia sinensis]|uniref:disease resistance protein RPM1-like n=1 Tax=Camellia sinensis TaxID=4442 RepID=UPI001036653F|nr:disease resistance protein RPM1-like [Camellia sinensis]